MYNFKHLFYPDSVDFAKEIIRFDQVSKTYFVYKFKI
jgi:hypothetical protein